MVKIFKFIFICLSFSSLIGMGFDTTYVSKSHRSTIQNADSATNSFSKISSVISDLQEKYEAQRLDLQLQIEETQSSSKQKSLSKKIKNVEGVLDSAMELKDSIDSLQNRVDFIVQSSDALGDLIQDGTISKKQLTSINDASDLLKSLSKKSSIKSSDLTSLNKKVQLAEQKLKKINDTVQSRIEQNDYSQYINEQKSKFEKKVNESDPRGLGPDQYPELIQGSFDKFSNYKDVVVQSLKQNRTGLKSILNDKATSFDTLTSKIDKITNNLNSSLNNLKTMNSKLIEIQDLINNNPSKIHAFELTSQLKTLESESANIDSVLTEKARKVIDYYAKVGEKISDIANDFVFGTKSKPGVIDSNTQIESFLERSKQKIESIKQKLSEAQEAKKSFESFDQSQAKKDFDALGQELFENLQEQAKLPEGSSELEDLKNKELEIKRQMQNPISEKEFVENVEKRLGSLYDDSFEDLGITDDQGSGSTEPGSTGGDIGDRGGFDGDRTGYEGGDYYRPEGEFNGL